MGSGGLPASYCERLRARVAGCDQPLIQLWGWPASGKRAFLEHLAASEPERCRRLRDVGDLDGRGEWLILDAGATARELLDAAARLGRDRRLIYAAERRELDELLPQRTLGPGELLLRTGEVEELAARHGASRAGRAEELHRLSDGWYGPLRWLLERLEHDEAASATREIDSDAFRSFAERSILERLDPEVRAAAERLSRVESLDPELWRLLWRRRPERLAALERLLYEWGLVLAPGDGPLRLPVPLRAALDARSVRAEDPAATTALLRRLGVVAAALGRGEDAGLYLHRAGDETLELRWLELDGASPVVAAAPGYRLQLLGLPAAYRLDARGGATEVAWRLRRAFHSLAFLALRPDRRATRDELVEALWTDAGESAVRRNFHPTLSEARRTLTGGRGPDPLLFRQGVYQLNPALVWEIDCLRFERLVSGGRELARVRLEGDRPEDPAADEGVLELLSRAWRLYRGPLLADLEASWVTPYRERLAREYLRLLRTLGELARRLGRDTLALDAWRSVLFEEPFEERIHLKIMELYARHGRRDLVRRQYVKLQELLAEDLDVEPLEETQERYHELMR